MKLDLKELIAKQLTEKRVKYVDVAYGNVSVTSGNYKEITLGTEPFRGKSVISAMPIRWGSNSGAFSIITETGAYVYIIANNGVSVTNLTVRFAYID